MRAIVKKHLISTAIVLLILSLFYLHWRTEVSPQQKEGGLLKAFTQLAPDVNDPFQKQLFFEMARDMAPQRYEQLQKLWKAYASGKLQKRELQEKQKLSNRVSVFKLLGMYFKFLMVYLLVIFLNYYAVQTLGTYFFIRYQQHAPPLFYRLLFSFRLVLHEGDWRLLKRPFKLMGILLAKGIFYFLLFAPAYVIAYSVKSDFRTESLVFMILLGVFSNGVLIIYSNKFFQFLLNEGRKGYVKTALVKNLNDNYTLGKRTGIPFKRLFALSKKFPNHVLQHIFLNARFQYLSTLKEQAAYIISGLVIIEMALNIHEHLNYELLRQLLFRNYDLVVLILMLLFVTVKATETFADLMVYRELKRMERP